MKKNKLLIWGSVLVIVILIFVVIEVLKDKKPSEKATKFFPDASTESITAIRIKDQNGSVRIVRKGDLWVVAKTADESETGVDLTNPMQENTDSTANDTSETKVEKIKKDLPADSASVVTALEKIVAMKKDVLISENPEKQSIFEVDTANGILVEIWKNDNESMGSFFVGKRAADWSSNYVRMLGSDLVYSTSGNIRSSFFSERDRWIDKAILSFDRASATKVSLFKKGASSVITIEKSSDTSTVWNIAEPVKSPAKSEEVDEIISTLSNFKANQIEEYAFSESVMGFTEPELVATISIPGGSKKIIVGNKKEDTSNFWVKTEGKDVVFLVNDYEIQKLDKTVEGLKQERETNDEKK